MNFRFITPQLERILLFGMGGSTAAALNLLLVYAGIEVFGFDSALQQNYVNVVTMEISLLYSFLVYKNLVWRDSTPYASRAFLRQLSLYHMSAGSGVLTRTFLFPALQFFGAHYLVNVVVGILCGAAINFLLSNRYVFKAPVSEKNL